MTKPRVDPVLLKALGTALAKVRAELRDELGIRIAAQLDALRSENARLLLRLVEFEARLERRETADATVIDARQVLGRARRAA